MIGDKLAVIDMQKVYESGAPWECDGISGAADNIARLIESDALDDISFTRFVLSENGIRHSTAVFTMSLHAAISSRVSRRMRVNIRALTRRGTQPIGARILPRGQAVRIGSSSQALSQNAVYWQQCSMPPTAVRM